MTETETFDFTKTYAAAGQAGIAWRATGYETETVSEWVFLGDEDDDTDDESLYAFDEDERTTGRIEAHMVGDDRTFTFDVDELTAIDEDDYCSCCGQIGCGWG